MDITAKELSLKRSADGTNDSDAATPKRRNTGVIDGRKARRSAYTNPLGGTPNDPLNLNTSGSEKSAYDRIKRLEECHVLPGAVHQRRFSFRTSHGKKKLGKQVSVDVKKEEPLNEVDKISKKKAKKEKKMANRYRYGNFNYFHRIQAPFQNDPRLDLMCDDWFKDKTVLDIGCNSGQLTISIAREFGPNRILGIDIDYHLIAAARKNLRHFRDKEAKLVGRFPASFPFNFGPISMPSATTSNQFPENVWFREQNYVLNDDEQLNEVEEEYDIILAWSISKWVHLNWGDDGLKRFFKRIFKQLKPNGKFLLEPQTRCGYKKRARTHPELQRNLKAIQFWPEQFKDYLCNEIGFVHCEELENPLIQHLGYDGPLQLYYKEQFLWHDAPMQIPNEPASISPFYNYLPSNTPRADSQSTPQHTLVFTPPQTPEDDIRYGR
ncbi:hypothetical protein M3Y94_00830700 [Aphelenchoides besseyi]|nr:hypothetical protein M3Y94_00830700 [Aphelenchoides besseyi]